VRTQVRNIHGCDVDDAKAIVTASAAIVAAAAEAKAGGDKAVAMVKVIEQLAVIRERWKHCKETANKNGTSLGATASLSSLVDARASPFVDVGLDEGGIDVVTLAELLADE
jgi:hypothetical protein